MKRAFLLAKIEARAAAEAGFQRKTRKAYALRLNLDAEFTRERGKRLFVEIHYARGVAADAGAAVDQ
ncbi:hypothetical protein SDC9_142282 [bioreactor metagenome]|uniref:Uncharacterized protein n=1 Tax=bioreactor metagenome TaxID=1076179 RepID=A0A645E0P8_9ZZZZ